MALSYCTAHFPARRTQKVHGHALGIVGLAQTLLTLVLYPTAAREVVTVRMNNSQRYLSG